MKQPILLLVLLCASLAAGAQTSEIYKWVDADGNVHYGDRPDRVDGNPVEVIEIASARTNPVAVQEGVSARLARQEERAEEKELEAQAEEEAAEAQREREAKKEQCAAYRARLERFNTARRLYRTDENGERIYLDEAQMQQTRDDLRANIQENCAGL